MDKRTLYRQHDTFMVTWWYVIQEYVMHYKTASRSCISCKRWPEDELTANLIDAGASSTPLHNFMQGIYAAI